MITQYSAAAVASELKVLAHPASADSIPTSAGQEDFVPMGMGAALKARAAVRSATTGVAIATTVACLVAILVLSLLARRAVPVLHGIAVGLALFAVGCALALLGGVFYSARTLDEPWSTLTRLDPLYYLVDATRAGFTGFHESPTPVSLIVAVGVALAAFAAATLLFTRGWRLKP